tara:strand:- start:10577 stop:11263 length:687 start_codon:yes stop_codon:yes gene_type:complete
MSETDAVLDIRSVAKAFHQGGVVLNVLRQIDLQVQTGETVALVGPSGSGKSTLLHIAALLEKPDSGSVRICGTDCTDMSDAARTQTRRDKLGMVYQFHHLMPEFSAEENVMMPMLIKRISRQSANSRARELLKGFGLGDRLDHRPARLSGGEQQRVAIARAVANEPAILLADEPTGNLDQQTADAVFENLIELVRKHSLAALIATHNFEMAQRMDRVMSLQDGVLVTI